MICAKPALIVLIRLCLYDFTALNLRKTSYYTRVSVFKWGLFSNLYYFPDNSFHHLLMVNLIKTASFIIPNCETPVRLYCWYRQYTLCRRLCEKRTMVSGTSLTYLNTLIWMRDSLFMQMLCCIFVLKYNGIMVWINVVKHML